jgi:hypothetical protein
MLEKLLEQIEGVIPVKAIVSYNNSVNIEYFDNNQPDQDQLTEINNILASWPLEKVKLQKIQELDNVWKSVMKAGWTTPSGYKLGIDVQDIALFNGVFVLAKEASAIGINDPITIIDLDGVPHSLSLQNLTVLMLQYGQARSAINGQYTSIKQAITSATSIEDVNSINLTIGA